MTDIDVLLQETRKFTPTAEFSRAANVPSRDVYDRAARDPEAFWAQQARELEWSTPFTKVLEWNAPWAKWFLGGKLNASVNCLDRHLRGPRRNKAALIWEGEPGDTRTFTYWDLHREVCRFGNVLPARREPRRPRRDLSAHDSRSGDRDARVRSDRRAAFRGVRGILG